jgi:hypothetical protein
LISTCEFYIYCGEYCGEIKEGGLGGAYGTLGEKKNEYGVLVGKLEGRRSRGYDRS